jgi:hypothetical protein
VVVWVVDIILLMLVLLVDQVVVLLDIQAVVRQKLVEMELVIHSQETLAMILLQMDGDMMVVEVILQQFSKVLVEVVLVKLDIQVNQELQLMDMVDQVFNFQQHSKILDLHQAELVELVQLVDLVVV